MLNRRLQVTERVTLTAEADCAENGVFETVVVSAGRITGG